VPALPPSNSFDTFAIGFDRRDRTMLQSLWDGILDRQVWSQGPVTEAFEEAWSTWNRLGSVAMSSWAGAALAALRFAEVSGRVVLCPSNTFMANPLTIAAAGGSVEYVDCNRDDLCVSFADFEEKVRRHRPVAAFVVHIGGHIAFEIERIAELCRAEGIFLIEDCAHAHGAEWHGRRPGAWGDAAVWSFAATKTISTGEGGMLVSRRDDVLAFARAFRDYGKPDYEIGGLNFRMNEFTSAIGLVQVQRLDEIVAWKNAVASERLDRVYPSRVELPDGMRSGLYKYIVFEPIANSTGKVYDRPCHRITGSSVDLPNTDWVARNHWCVPLYYRPVKVAEDVVAA
jgi:dTDP-4-amino-4,6-dideoxygalactose transaminase